MSVTTSGQSQDRDHGLIEWWLELFRDQYADEIVDLARHYPKEQQTLWVEYRDLWEKDIDAVDEDLKRRPQKFLNAAEDALVEYDIAVNVDFEGAHVRITDSEEWMATVSVSDLGSDDIGEFRAVQGIIDRVTKVSPRLETAAYVCLRCGSVTKVPQTRTGVQDPHQCDGCEREGPFNLDAGESEFVDVRQVKLSQPPAERVQEGGEGESILVYVEDDLVEVGGEHGLADRAGEHATVFGTVRLAEGQMSSKSDKSPLFDQYLDANGISFEAEGIEDIEIGEYEEQLEELKQRAGDGLIEAYRDSIAPNIMASDKLETFLEAGVAWLFNAYRIDPENRGSYRGDLHMGIIGDPGLGKSTILESLHRIAPKSEFRSGTGLSAVGLTAAAVQEEFAGQTEWTLQPGVLPRANGGHCIIDEIDDVVDEDTKKMHDALEGEQLVKVDKAGIHADLPTRTALLVSGNPTDGRFDRYEKPANQVDLDPALISRLDVLFALQDIPDPDTDAELADHVLESWDELSRMEVSERVADVETPERTETTEPEISVDVFRAAVAYARENVFPRLTGEVKDRLREYYVEVRDLNDNPDDPVPAQPRTLEAGVRLAVAFARAEFCEDVQLRHAERAIKISQEVVGLNYDPDTGKFDANRTGKGTPKSERDRKKTLKSIVEELDSDGSGAAPIEDVYDKAEEAGIDRSKAEHDIEKWKRAGEMYEPATGEVRFA